MAHTVNEVDFRFDVLHVQHHSCTSTAVKRWLIASTASSQFTSMLFSVMVDAIASNIVIMRPDGGTFRGGTVFHGTSNRSRTLGQLGVSHVYHRVPPGLISTAAATAQLVIRDEGIKLLRLDFKEHGGFIGVGSGKHFTEGGIIEL